MNKSKIIGSAIDVATHLAPLIAAGTGGALAIAAGKAALDLIEDLNETAGAAPEKVAEFERSREELERAVNAHADRVIDSLGDADA